ncbi:MAG: hypothetical protein EXR29_07605 [Betaproteobacteria bacterium]|nr:hypothetical protein [Betaproteobacteria bacterium]
MSVAADVYPGFVIPRLIKRNTVLFALPQSFTGAGMFAFTVPLGKPADRFGRERVMYPGVAVALVGSILVALPPLVMWCALQLGGRAARDQASG